MFWVLFAQLGVFLRICCIWAGKSSAQTEVTEPLSINRRKLPQAVCFTTRSIEPGGRPACF